MRLAAMLPNGRGGLYCGRITVASGRIVDVGPLPDGGPDGQTDVDFTPHVALPGFIDLQLNGAFGHDITTDPSKMWPIGERLLSHGVTSFLPTVITSPPQQRQAAYAAIRSRPAGYRGAMPLGLHIEGPELAPDYAGVHPRTELVSGPEGLSTELLRQADVVALMTVAPEVQSASTSIEQLVEAGIAVSLGHTAATAAQAFAALDAGASALTHVFNGMGPLHHREVGAAGAGLLHPHAYVSLIADDHHLSEEAIQIAWRLAGPGRICLVTDAMAGMDAPAATYRIGSESVECGEAARSRNGSLAGSLLTMPQAVRQVQRVTGATWDELAAISSTEPCRSAPRHRPRTAGTRPARRHRHREPAASAGGHHARRKDRLPPDRAHQRSSIPIDEREARVRDVHIGRHWSRHRRHRLQSGRVRRHEVGPSAAGQHRARQAGCRGPGLHP